METFTQKLGIFFYRNLDAGGFIFEVLKVQNRATRYMLYIAFPLLFLVAGLYFGNRINLRDSALFLSHPLAFSIIIFLAKVGFYGAVFAVFFLFTYENLILKNIDIKKENEKKKSDAKYRKINKLQWWRLRNMNLFFRILFYIIIYIFLVQFFEVVAMKAAIESQENQSQVIQSFKNFMLYFTSLYMFVSLYIEYRISKLKAK